MLFVVGALPTGLAATKNEPKKIKVNVLDHVQQEESLKKQNELVEANKKLTEENNSLKNNIQKDAQEHLDKLKTFQNLAVGSKKLQEENKKLQKENVGLKQVSKDLGTQVSKYKEKETLRNEKKTKRQDEIAARKLRSENRHRVYSVLLNLSRTAGTAGVQATIFGLMSWTANGLYPNAPESLRNELRAIARDAKLPWANELRVKLFPGNVENAAAGYDILHPNSPFALIGMGLWDKLTLDEQRMIFLHECFHIDDGHVLEALLFLAKRGIPLAILGVQSLPYVYLGSKWCVNKTGEGISAATQWATQKTKSFAWYLTPEFIRNRFLTGEVKEAPVKNSASWMPARVTAVIDWARELKNDLGQEFNNDHLVRSYRSFIANNERLAPVIFGTERPRSLIETGIGTVGSFAWGMAAYHLSTQLFRTGALALGKGHEWSADRFALDHARGRGDVLAFKNAFAKMLAGDMSCLSDRYSNELWGKSQAEREQFLRHKIESMHKNDVHPTPWQRMELCDEYLKKFPVPDPERR
ncbi:TPA: hypothetical protein DEG75_00705 [Candidatus Dependentiae bacterium]|nr:hypothetical protein [Candidatus Dependentiae bacterium]